MHDSEELRERFKLQNKKPQLSTLRKSATMEFSFPFTPYSIQDDLMNHLYATLSQSKVTVIESPTGTGKSLSLLCASLTWLAHHRIQHREQLEAKLRADWLQNDCNKEEPSWVLDQEIKRQLATLDRDEQALEERLARLRLEETRQKNTDRKKPVGCTFPTSTQRFAHRFAQKYTHAPTNSVDPEDEFAPDPYDSDGVGANDNYTPAVRELVKKWIEPLSLLVTSTDIEQIHGWAFGQD